MARVQVRTGRSNGFFAPPGFDPYKTRPSPAPPRPRKPGRPGPVPMPRYELPLSPKHWPSKGGGYAKYAGRLFRLTPYGRLPGLLSDLMSFADFDTLPMTVQSMIRNPNQPGGVILYPQSPPGTCRDYGFVDMGPTAGGCGATHSQNNYSAGEPGQPGNPCTHTVWHHAWQAILPPYVQTKTPSVIAYGRVVGGVAGCSAYNMEHVWVQNSPVAYDPKVVPAPVVVGPSAPPLPVERDVHIGSSPAQRPNPKPAYVEPSAEIKRNPPRLVPADHKLTPDTPPQKNKRFFLNGGALKRVGDKIVGPITEVKDFMDALADGLPDEMKREYRFQKGLHNKIKYLYDNIDHINTGKAALAYAKAQLGDMLIGKVAVKNPSRYWAGARGPSITRHHY